MVSSIFMVRSFLLPRWQTHSRPAVFVLFHCMPWYLQGQNYQEGSLLTPSHFLGAWGTRYSGGQTNQAMSVSQAANLLFGEAHQVGKLVYQGPAYLFGELTASAATGDEIASVKHDLVGAVGGLDAAKVKGNPLEQAQKRVGVGQVHLAAKLGGRFVLDDHGDFVEVSAELRFDRLDRLLHVLVEFLPGDFHGAIIPHRAGLSPVRQWRVAAGPAGGS